MCPERSLLSSYLDNELEPSRAQRVEAHLVHCAGCHQRLRAYQRVSHALLESREPDINAAGDRVWRRLEPARAGVEGQATFWTRGVRVSAPVAVAAMAITLLITSVALWARMSDSRSDLANLGPGAGAVPVGSPVAAAEPWPAQGAIVIQLPEEPLFLQLGTPAILREEELMQVAELDPTRR